VRIKGTVKKKAVLFPVILNDKTWAFNRKEPADMERKNLRFLVSLINQKPLYETTHGLPPSLIPLFFMLTCSLCFIERIVEYYKHSQLGMTSRRKVHASNMPFYLPAGLNTFQLKCFDEIKNTKMSTFTRRA